MRRISTLGIELLDHLTWAAKKTIIENNVYICDAHDRKLWAGCN